MQNNQTEITFDAPPQFNFQNFADPPYSYSPTNDPLQYNNQQVPFKISLFLGRKIFDTSRYLITDAFFLQPNNQPAPERSNNSMFSLRFYQDLFDVNTDEVINRIKWSMVPNPRVNYLQNYIRNKPDLYGPFWICVTLVFTIAASGNLAEYLQTAAARNYHWKYDFHAITAAGTVIFCYAWLLPVILWAILHLYGNEQVSSVRAYIL